MDETRARTSDARARMVAAQLRGRDITDARVLAAMAAVPREAFVRPSDRDHAYEDHPLSIGAGQTISQPYIVARMTELLAVGPGDRVLDVGTGSGYQAAVLAELGCQVTSIEREPPRRGSLRAPRPPGLCRPRHGDRRRRKPGPPGRCPVGRDSRRGCGAAIPEALRDQLGDGRRLVIPVGSRREQLLLIVERHGSEWTERSDGACVFVPLIGAEGWRE